LRSVVPRLRKTARPGAAKVVAVHAGLGGPAPSDHLESAFFNSLINFSVSSNFRMIWGSPFIAANVVHG
jgi:hypothetical protein